jgi:hypothetical protein
MPASPRTAIRHAFARLGMHAAADQIVAELACFGFDVSPTLVSKIRAELIRKEAKAQRQRAKPLAHDKRRKRPQQRKIPPSRK